ncbi:hypothetical protein [Myxococcus qinghaiensis]|uniref:hypothetical protein n=1 Tax=Myxococcus qinghaiensis TaxID=2906758 RepID=UPI0020A7EEDC|nr:hypothetical protein [Myxococcus qinghaiensis]MCP3162334.1 hypothetical protein [Myxococcus qinghaiensis]
MFKGMWLRCVVLAALLVGSPACDDTEVVVPDAGMEEVDAGPVDGAPVVFRITNVGNCAAKLLTTVKGQVNASIRVQQGELEGTAFGTCGCPYTCPGNNYHDTFPIMPGATVEFPWSGNRYISEGRCDVRRLAFGPARVTIPYFTLADAQAGFKGPEVNVSQDFDFTPDGGVVEIVLNPPKDLLVDGGAGVCP